MLQASNTLAFFSPIFSTTVDSIVESAHHELVETVKENEMSKFGTTPTLLASFPDMGADFYNKLKGAEA